MFYYFLVACLVSTTTITMAMPSKWIELSYKYDNSTLNWPGSTKFVHKLVFYGRTPSYFYSNYDISSSEHAGTHLDSPIHFYAGKWTTDQIPLDSLIGDAVVVNITRKAMNDPDARCTVDDLQEWEKTNGKIPEDAILLLLTGWGRHWPVAEKYFGTNSTNSSLFHFPGLHEDAAQWLIDNRKIKLFGLDTPSLDYGQSKDFKTHQILFSKNIPGIENIANLEKLPAKGATVYAVPQFIKDGSGGPCRVFATITRDDVVNQASIGVISVPFLAMVNALVALYVMI